MFADIFRSGGALQDQKEYGKCREVVNLCPNFKHKIIRTSKKNKHFFVSILCSNAVTTWTSSLPCTQIYEFPWKVTVLNLRFILYTGVVNIVSTMSGKF